MSDPTSIQEVQRKPNRLGTAFCASLQGSGEKSLSKGEGSMLNAVRLSNRNLSGRCDQRYEPEAESMQRKQENVRQY